MTILLQHPITEKPKKPGIYWFEYENDRIIKGRIIQKNIQDWDLSNICKFWYEQIELPDDAVIVQ